MQNYFPHSQTLILLLLRRTLCFERNFVFFKDIKSTVKIFSFKKIGRPKLKELKTRTTFVLDYGFGVFLDLPMF